MRDLLEDIHAEPLTEFHHPFLMSGRAEVPSFTRESQKIFVAAVIAFHTGKAVVQIAAVEITVDHLFDIGPPEAVISGKPVVINLHEGFKVILHAVVITGSLRISGPINGGWDSHDPSPPRKAGRRLQNVRFICQAEYRALLSKLAFKNTGAC